MCESLPKASLRIGPSYAKAGQGLYFFSAVLAERERGKGLTGVMELRLDDAWFSGMEE